MLRRQFLSTLAALPFAGRLVKAGPTMHWATPHSTPLADMIAMRDRFRAASIGLQADPVADRINEALESQR